MKCVRHGKNLDFLTIRPAGLEPATLGSEDRYSIQLSYGRISEKYDSFSRSVQGLVLANLGSIFFFASIVGIAATDFTEFRSLAPGVTSPKKVDLAPT